MSTPVVAVAGPTGDLGARITRALLTRGAHVRALTRPGSPVVAPENPGTPRGPGADTVTVDPDDVDALTAALQGVDVVVSALNGLAPVILDRQLLLLEAAGRAGVPRFFSSDYSADFTRAAPGGNRNFDLRRQFMARAAGSPVALTSVMNGAFMDMLDGVMPIIQPRVRAVPFWGDPDQVLDFTTKDDTAAYTAAAAVRPEAQRFVRVAGDSVSPRDIAEAMSEVTGRRHRLVRAGSVASLALLTRVTKAVAPRRRDVFPAWQGMQYMRDMSEGDVQLRPLDNGTFPEVQPTRVRDYLAATMSPTSPR